MGQQRRREEILVEMAGLGAVLPGSLVERSRPACTGPMPPGCAKKAGIK